MYAPLRPLQAHHRRPSDLDHRVTPLREDLMGKTIAMVTSSQL